VSAETDASDEDEELPPAEAHMERRRGMRWADDDDKSD
jgi:hypothetical protein